MTTRPRDVTTRALKLVARGARALLDARLLIAEASNNIGDAILILHALDARTGRRDPSKRKPSKRPASKRGKR